MEKSTCLRKKGLTSKEILHKFLQDAITANNLKMTKEAVKLGADLKEKFFYSDLYVSNKKPEKEGNVHSFSGYSVLAYALSYGDYNLIKFLIDSGADPKEKLLFLTVFSSNTKIDIDILKLLINSGAKISYDEIRTIRISVDATDFKFFIKIAKLSKKELNELLLYLCSFPIGLKEKDEGFIKNHAKKVKILIEDTLRIRDIVTNENIKSVVVIGGGYVGVEAAENLKEIGIDVTIVDKQNQVLGQLDEDMVSFVHSHLKAKGIRLVLGNGVQGFESNDNGVNVKLDNHPSINADIVLLSIGVVPDSKLAKEAGLELSVRNSIAVNDHMQTSDKNIYAVGDAVSILNAVTNQLSTISLAGPANKQGRIAADNIAGLDSCYKGSVASSVLKVFDVTVATTGINERIAKANGIDCEKIIISPASHASYYPGGTVMTIKFLFDKVNERIIGAQIVGFDGVDKRIDVIATAMQAGMKATELKDLDLSYAPPYSSAKDPVNMLGFVAENVMTGKVKHFYYEDIENLINDTNAILLDTRTVWEYNNGHAKGFETHIPVDNLRERLGEMDKSKKIYVMCQSGLRSYIACRLLSQEGFDCYNFAGGYRFYKSVSENSFDEKCSTDCGMIK